MRAKGVVSGCQGFSRAGEQSDGHIFGTGAGRPDHLKTNKSGGNVGAKIERHGYH